MDFEMKQLALVGECPSFCLGSVSVSTIWLLALSQLCLCDGDRQTPAYQANLRSSLSFCQFIRNSLAAVIDHCPWFSLSVERLEAEFRGVENRKRPVLRDCRFLGACSREMILFGLVNQLFVGSSFSVGKYLRRQFLSFDATLGFPGEGPDSSPTFSLVTANVGSMNTSQLWKGWSDQVICVQETRVGVNNHRTTARHVKAHGRTFFPGRLLPGLINSQGIQKSSHGGTAIMGLEAITTPFDCSDDATGLYAKCHKTFRVTAAWVQVAPKIRLLVFSLYLKTAASALADVVKYNEEILTDVFSICSQFGDIPCVIAGDLQLRPDCYEPVSFALNFGGWSDPLTTVDSSGECVRPFTFSLDSSFPSSEEGCSSIDAILLNPVASAALVNISCIEATGTQHKPIRATFQWESLSQVGFQLHKTAPFDISAVPKFDVNDPVDPLHITAFHTLAAYQPDLDDPSISIERKWEVANQICIDTLVHNGAVWGRGPQVRGQAPSFRKKQIFLGQTPSGCARTKLADNIHKALRLVSELTFRLSRTSRSDSDQHTTDRTARRLWCHLRSCQYQYLWIEHTHPSAQQLADAGLWLQQVLKDHEHKKKLARIRSWKHKIQMCQQDGCKFVYQHLKSRATDEPANLVQDENQQIVYDPIQAIECINSQWDDVFAANVMHEDPVKVLQIIWPYIKHDFHPISLPEISALDLFVQEKA